MPESVPWEVEVGYKEKVVPPEGGGALNMLPREWAQPHGCQSSGSVWTVLSDTGLDGWGVCAGPSSKQCIPTIHIPLDGHDLSINKLMFMATASPGADSGFSVLLKFT